MGLRDCRRSGQPVDWYNSVRMRTVVLFFVLSVTCRLQGAVLTGQKTDDDVMDADDYVYETPVVFPEDGNVNVWNDDDVEYDDDDDSEDEEEESENTERNLNHLVDLDCVETIEHKDLFDVNKPSAPNGCWPDDERCPRGSKKPGPPRELSTGIVFSNHSGSCEARVLVNWKVPSGLQCLKGFRVTLFIDVERQVCVTLRFKEGVNVSALSDISNVSFSYNCLKVQLNSPYIVAVESLPACTENIVQTERLVIVTKYEENPCAPLVHNYTEQENVTDDRLAKSQAVIGAPDSHSAGRDAVRRLTTTDLAIIIPLAACALVLLVLLGVFIPKLLKNHPSAVCHSHRNRERCEHDGEPTAKCSCSHCALRNTRFVAPNVDVDDDGHGHRQPYFHPPEEFVDSDDSESNTDSFIPPAECFGSIEFTRNSGNNETERINQPFEPHFEYSRSVEEGYCTNSYGDEENERYNSSMSAQELIR